MQGTSRVRLYKTRLVRELFIRTADENYIVARWCAFEGFHTDFFWLAVHAVEKYMKAVLLLNGRSSKPYKHDIVRLYANVSEIAAELLPVQLLQPTKLNIGRWRTRTAAEFVSWLDQNGNPDNRYATYGYVAQAQDVHMLDQLVFALRRLGCELEGAVFADASCTTATKTYRTLLAEQPSWLNSLDMPLDRLIDEQIYTARRHAALNLNLSFAPPDFVHQGARSRSMSRNPVICWGLIEPLESDDRDFVADNIEVAEWLLENIQVPKGKSNDPGVREQIKDAIKSAREKHGLHKT
ncbi:HEPN domain-containing protein [Aureimonas psammosilenae]|uniref:HEPN domain-containing protein n=1 Tax=Aureimonas psammosilenae TaxID=2495496 RepID=UPI0012609645|nr:HEPN domain-containing protein [Aureimonas psammosilenae]